MFIHVCVHAIISVGSFVLVYILLYLKIILFGRLTHWGSQTAPNSGHHSTLQPSIHSSIHLFIPTFRLNTNNNKNKVNISTTKANVTKTDIIYVATDIWWVMSGSAVVNKCTCTCMNEWMNKGIQQAMN